MPNFDSTIAWALCDLVDATAKDLDLMVQDGGDLALMSVEHQAFCAFRRSVRVLREANAPLTAAAIDLHQKIEVAYREAFDEDLPTAEEAALGLSRRAWEELRSQRGV